MKFPLLLLLLAISSFCLGQSEKQIVDSLFYGQTGTQKTNPKDGLVIGIFNKNQTHYYAIGRRSINGIESLDSLSIFEIGSATKTFTALLLAIQIQKHNLGINDAIDQYLPADIHLPNSYRNKIKLTDLASHQSGLPNLSSDKYFSELLSKDARNPFRFVDQDYLYYILKETDTLTNYGKYQYNNYAFSLLGTLLEKQSGMSYNAAIGKYILKPLKMNSTTFGTVGSLDVAGLYDQRGVPQEHMILSAVSPAGGLKSNAVDLIKYLKMQISPNEDFKAAVNLTQEVFYRDSTRRVGLGWDIVDDYFQKDGDTFGNSCLLRINKQKQLAIVVLSNHQNGKLVRDAVDFIYNKL